MTKDSTSADDATGQPAALSRSDETLGSFLKRHRKSQGKDLEEIAKKTRIHASSLRAIEEDNPKALPAEVFTRGFVKNYAQYLGLDPNETLAWYIEQNNGEARPTEKINVQEVLAGEAMAEGRSFPGGRLILVFIVLGIFSLAVYLVLSFLNASAPPANIAPKEVAPQSVIEPQPSSPAPVVGESGAEPETGGGDQTIPAVQDGAQAPVQPVLGTDMEKTGGDEKKPQSLSEEEVQVAEPQKVGVGQSLGDKKTTAGGTPVIVPQAFKEKPGQNMERQEVVKPAPVAVVPPQVLLEKAPGTINYVLEAKFTDTTWLSAQVDKEKKKSGIYKPGDHLVWQAEKKISLFVGNAGGIVLTLNGKPVPSLGKPMESTRVSFPAE